MINSHGRYKNKNENNDDNKNRSKIEDNDDIFSFFSMPNISVLSPVPNDTSTLLLSGNHGFVCKIVRFGEPSPPTNFCHPATGRMEINVKKKWGIKILLILSLPWTHFLLLLWKGNVQIIFSVIMPVLRNSISYCNYFLSIALIEQQLLVQCSDDHWCVWLSIRWRFM